MVIFYGLSGEGLGHASRTLAVLDHLKEHETHLFTYGKAYEFLKSLNISNVHLIQGMLFSYTRNKVDYFRTFNNAANYFLFKINRNIEFIADCAKRHKPDLFIADFEPSIARAAKVCRKPLISIDNQHRFAYTDFEKLPMKLRVYGWFCGFAAKMLVPSPDFTVISTFHYDSIEPKKGKRVKLTNGLIREELEKVRIENKGHLLVYTRHTVSTRMLNALANVTMPVKVYGAKKPDGFDKSNFTFLPFSKDFMYDFASSAAVFTTAGNQLLSEARYLGKPVLVVPEPEQYEQYINAFYVEKLGMGKQCMANNLKPHIVDEFLRDFKVEMDRHPNGVYDIVDIIKETSCQ